MSATTTVKNKMEIHTTVESTFFSCAQLNTPSHYQTMDESAYAMSKDHEPNNIKLTEKEKSDLQKAREIMLAMGQMPIAPAKDYPSDNERGYFAVDAGILQKRLCEIWFRCFTDWWYDAKKEFKIGGTVKMRLEGAYTPKDCNWTSDSATIDIHMNHVACSWLQKFVTKHREDFNAFLQFAHGSRDGFHAYPPTDYWTWLETFTSPHHASRHRRGKEELDNNLAVGRGYDFVLFGQKDGKFSEDILRERVGKFNEDLWNVELRTQWDDIETESIRFVPDRSYESNNE